MLYEVELKFPVADVNALRDRLLTLAAAFESPIDQVDGYFNHPARDFGQTDEALRLRQVGDENFITYKGPKLDAQTKTRREIELPLAGGSAALEQFVELLVALGFRRVLSVRKRREPGQLDWEGQHVHIAIDRVEGLGDYLELEISAESSGLPAARAALTSLAKALDLPTSERRGYLEMLLDSS